MRRVLSAAAIAAFALSGLTGSGASAEGPLTCNNPKYSNACETANAVYDALVGGLPPGPSVECNHPWYANACETVRDLFSS